MRVVHVNIVRPRERADPEELLDTWQTLGDVATAVHRAGADVTVVQSFHRDAELVREGVKFRFVAEPALPGRTVGLLPRRLADAAREQAPDVIHVNGLDFAWHTQVLCGIGVPVLAQDHASVPYARRIRRRWGLARVAGVAFTDARQAEPFFHNGSFRQGMPIYSVPESSTHFTTGNIDEARAETGIYGDPAVLWVGRLDANKDPLTLLDALEQAARELPELQLWCCFHEQPLLGEVRARLARSPDLAARVHLLGRVPHGTIQVMCRAADFFMLGSHREGSGYALIEALACGATPVVSDIPAFRGLTLNGRVGALVPTGDAATFARALIELAGHPRGPLRRRAVDHFARELSFDVIGRRLCAIYETLLREAM